MTALRAAHGLFRWVCQSPIAARRRRCCAAAAGVQTLVALIEPVDDAFAVLDWVCGRRT